MGIERERERERGSYKGEQKDESTYFLVYWSQLDSFITLFIIEKCSSLNYDELNVFFHIQFLNSFIVTISLYIFTQFLLESIVIVVVVVVGVHGRLHIEARVVKRPL